MPEPAFDHLVVLMLENRSFDHLLGSLGRAGSVPVDGGQPDDLINVGLSGEVVHIGQAGSVTAPDMPHDFASVAVSLSGSNAGFVLADQLHRAGGPTADAGRVMSYFAPGDLPVLHKLATTYGVCDRWFSSVPAGTWPNRLFAIAAQSAGAVDNTVPLTLFELRTVFDALAPQDWVVYNDQIPNVALVRHLALRWLAPHSATSQFRSIPQFEQDCAGGHLPAFSWIEPVYLGASANDAHPPHDIRAAEGFVARVYGALRGSSAWDRCLFVVTFDEHGGFFDHVPPPVGVPAAVETGKYGFPFTRLGPRVPTLIIGPRVAAGSVLRPPASGFADHTSIIATILRRHGLPALTQRDEAAWDLLEASSLSATRDDEEPLPGELSHLLGEPGAALGLELADPLSPSNLAGLSGQEVAGVIAAAAPPAEPDTSELFGLGAPARVGLLGQDEGLEQALTRLAQLLDALGQLR